MNALKHLPFLHSWRYCCLLSLASPACPLIVRVCLRQRAVDFFSDAAAIQILGPIPAA